MSKLADSGGLMDYIAQSVPVGSYSVPLRLNFSDTSLEVLVLRL
jgi:hypothetical protein